MYMLMVLTCPFQLGMAAAGRPGNSAGTPEGTFAQGWELTHSFIQALASSDG